MPRARQTLVVMVKVPRPGRVKTRLGKDIGLVPAAWWFRHQVKRLLRRVQDPRWDTVLAVSPDHDGLRSRVWGGGRRIAQGRGDLGDRMARMLRSFPGKTCLIGADIPGVNRANVASAFHALGSSDVVFGPAPDGGFWLVGLHRMPPHLFDGVRWSTQHALSDTLENIPGSRVAFVQTLQDVDTVDDLVMTSRVDRDTARA